MEDLREIKGIPYPVDVRFRQIIVTGPPGGGKSTVIQRLGGWPQEGLLDLSAPRWWASRELAARPREVHLALPFRRVDSGLPLHHETWREDAANLEFAPERFVYPGPRRWWQIPWRSKYVFDFQIPPAEVILRAREKRARKGSHPIDEHLEPFEVDRQVLLYWEAARLLHQAGFRVLIRTEPAGPPLELTAKKSLVAAPRRRAPLIQRYWRSFLGYESARTLEAVEALELHGTKIRIPRALLPVALKIGSQTLRIDREPLLGAVDPSNLDLRHRVVLHDPEQLSSIHMDLRLGTEERVRLGTTETSLLTPKLPRDVPPRLEVVNQPEGVLLVDLDSSTGTEILPVPDAEQNLLRDRRQSAREHLEGVLAGFEKPLAPDAAMAQLGAVLKALEDAPYRERNRQGRPGGLVTLPPDLAPIIVGDLHTNLDNLLHLLTWNAFLPELEAGRAILVLLGDAVHRDRPPGIEEMESSILMMDAIFALMNHLPGGVLYVRGNHDSFSSDVHKASIPQGFLWRQALLRARGDAYVEAMESFYQSCPYVVESPGLVACHAGPPMESVRRKDLVEIVDRPRLQHQLTWNRFRAPNNPGGYGKREVREFLRVLDQPKAELLVSHTPPPGERSFVRDLAGIKRHHVVYAASPTSYAVGTRVLGRVVLLEYPGEAFQDP